jgi:hypothetical protein
MNFKWVGPIGLLAALVIGDQIRINRPGTNTGWQSRSKRLKASSRPPG